jgi:hypothetical protein
MIEIDNEKLDMLKSVFNKGGKFTVFYISDFMATCTRQEIVVSEIRERDFIFSKKGGRKKYIYPLVSQHYAGAPVKYCDHAVFAGYDLPLVADSDYTYSDRSQLYRGNCRYNFVGDPEKIKAYIDANQLNPFFDKELVEVYSGEIQNRDSDGIALYSKQSV